VLLFFRREVVFEPSLFMTEYFKFCGSFVALLLGGALVTLFWQSRQEALHLDRMRTAVMDHLTYIRGLSADANAAYAGRFEDRHRAKERIKNTNTLKSSLETAGAPLSSLVGDVIKTPDETLLDVTLVFIREVEPLLHQLRGLKLMMSEPGNVADEDELGRVLETIHTKVGAMIERLEGEASAGS
jgi:hypothetical protein